MAPSEIEKSMVLVEFRVPRLVHIHIGKTAGTSLRMTMHQALGPGSCSEPFAQTYMTEAEAARYDGFPVISGHISRADQIRWFPDRDVITLLREPIDRGLSFIHYVRSLPPESSIVARDARAMPILDLIETEDAKRNLHNTMVRQLGGHALDTPDDLPALLENAKETLRQAFWVGRRNTIDADLARLSALLGAEGLTPVQANVTPNRPPIETEDPAVVERLRALNDYDLQLWRWAQRELF